MLHCLSYSVMKRNNIENLRDLNQNKKNYLVLEREKENLIENQENKILKNT